MRGRTGAREERNEFFEGFGSILGVGRNLLLNRIVPDVHIAPNFLELVLGRPMRLEIRLHLNMHSRNVLVSCGILSIMIVPCPSLQYIYIHGLQPVKSVWLLW